MSNIIFKDDKTNNEVLTYVYDAHLKQGVITLSAGETVNDIGGVQYCISPSKLAEIVEYNAPMGRKESRLVVYLRKR